ncbi:MAG: bifunctional phosphopantothenoylcysteine decarboxylase/phosphopantothenate--cysteine ligase CoaBC [Magnetococcales bacterium]|nr:bifunctional phosphopantothenoylcysteine decarboxylase/phosphopantothenate--cysteine ligase CoaBC [Magnetococcales bacterium]
MLNFWNNKKIILIVSGGIAAYRGIDLIRSFREKGAGVTVIATASALEFVTALSFQALSGEPVHTELFQPGRDDAMDHIRLTREADLLVVAPATANLMAKAAQGLADDLASTVILAHNGPLLVAPAMNTVMWEKPATQRNRWQLEKDGAHVVEPASGTLACGDEGAGRLAPVEQIVEAAHALLTPKILAGYRLLITAGPTHEALDPVRFIANHSSGKMGWSICRAALRAGATVDLVHGPVTLVPPIGARCHPVTSAQQMYETCLGLWQEENGCDGAILTAAVGDFRPKKRLSDKIKKQSNSTELELSLTSNPDILASLARSAAGRLVVGFAAETGKALERGREKMQRKGCDLLVINDLLEKGAGFGVDTNRVSLLNQAGEMTHWPLLSKAKVGEKLIQTIASLFDSTRRAE